MNTFLYFHYGNRMLYFLFFLIQSKSTNIENRVQIRPILYFSQPIRLQIFFRVSDKAIFQILIIKITKSNAAPVKMSNIPLFVQICLVYPIIQKTNTIFQNLVLSLFSIYGKISSCKKLRKSKGQILRKMCHIQTYRQTDGQMPRTDFIGPLLQRWRFDRVFQKFENKIFLNYLA